MPRIAHTSAIVTSVLATSLLAPTISATADSAPTHPPAPRAATQCDVGSAGEDCFHSYCGDDEVIWPEYIDVNVARSQRLYFEYEEGLTGEKHYSQWMRQTGLPWRKTAEDVLHHCG